MKKIIIIAIATLVAAAALSASVRASDGSSSEGTVSFESSAMPMLNCTVSILHARDLYRMIPANISDLCADEYAAVRMKCSSRSHFVHEGVDVSVKESGGNVTIVLGVPGYKVTASNVTWEELDRMFYRSKTGSRINE